MILDTEPFDIRNTLEESLEMISFEANKKGLELISAIDPSVPQTVIGDSGRVRQIMVNLLSNAVKFSSRGEIVLRAKAKQVESEKGAYEITMSVQDEGIGIQEEDKNKLFQVFTQLDNSVTRRHVGSVSVIAYQAGRNWSWIIHMQKICRVDAWKNVCGIIEYSDC